MKEHKKDLDFEQSGGVSSQEAVVACMLYCSGFSYPLTQETREKMNTCTAIADICKDANTKIPVELHILKNNLREMYEDENNLHDFINKIAGGREFYKPVLVALEQHTKYCADQGGMFGQQTTYKNLVKKNPITLKVCGRIDEQNALIHETGLDPRRVVVDSSDGVRNIIIGLPAAPLDPGSDIRPESALEGIYEFNEGTLKRYGLPDGQLWKARKVGDYYHYHLEVGKAAGAAGGGQASGEQAGGAGVEVLKFHLHTDKGFSGDFTTTDATPGDDIEVEGYGNPAHRGRIKKLIVGNNQKNGTINNPGTNPEESRKLLISKEEGDLLQILVVIEALKNDEIVPRNVVITTTDHVVLTQFMTFLIENREAIEDNGYIVEVVYTGSMLDKQPGCITLTVYTNRAPSDGEKYLKALNGYLSKMKSHISSQSFLLLQAIAEHGNVVYEDRVRRRRGGVSRGFAYRAAECTKILQKKSDELKELIRLINNEIGSADSTYVPSDLLGEINTKIREYKTQFEIPVYISLEKKGGVKYYHIVDEKMIDGILERRYEPRIFAQSGGMKLIKQKGGFGASKRARTGAKQEFVVEEFDYEYTEKEGPPTKVTDKYDNREDKLEDEVLRALDLVSGVSDVRYVIFDVTNTKAGGEDGESVYEINTREDLLSSVDIGYLIMINNNFYEAYNAYSYYEDYIHMAHKLIAQEINESIIREANDFDYTHHHDLSYEAKTLDDEVIEQIRRVVAKSNMLRPRERAKYGGDGGDKATSFRRRYDEWLKEEEGRSRREDDLYDVEKELIEISDPETTSVTRFSPGRYIKDIYALYYYYITYIDHGGKDRLNLSKEETSELKDILKASGAPIREYSGGARKSVRRRKKRNGSKKKKQLSGGKYKNNALKRLKTTKHKSKKFTSKKRKRKYKTNTRL
jgi:hypothetical protein